MIHKILRKDTTPNGEKIQLEDWKEVYPTIEKTIKIAAYPVAKNGGYWIHKGDTFRLELSRNFSTDREVIHTFIGLVSGELSLDDLTTHYWNTDKDLYYMGLES